MSAPSELTAALPATAPGHGSPPCVNASASDFAVVGGAIRFGLADVTTVGTRAVESILGAPAVRSRFAHLVEFCGEVDLRRASRRVIEALIKCGAFDSLHQPRAALMASLAPCLPPAFGLSPSEALEADLEALFGRPVVRYE